MRPGGRDSVYCSDNTFATMLPATCTMEFRASTMRSKLVDLAVLGVSGFVGSAVARTIATALRCAEYLAARAAAGAATRAAADAADATASQMGKVAAAGKLGEQMAGIVIGDVKSVTYLRYTPQFRDFYLWAQQHNLQFNLYVRSDTKLSAELQQMVGDGRIITKISTKNDLNG